MPRAKRPPSTGKRHQHLDMLARLDTTLRDVLDTRMLAYQKLLNVIFGGMTIVGVVTMFWALATMSKADLNRFFPF